MRGSNLIPSERSEIGVLCHAYNPLPGTPCSASGMAPPDQAVNERERNGFTLVEVMVALAVFALVVSAVLGAYRGTIGVMDEADTQEIIYQMARVALERIKTDLECSYVPEPAKPSQDKGADTVDALFHGEKKEIGDLSWGELRFVSLAHLNFLDERPLAEPAEVSYYAAAGREKGVLDLYRTDTPVSRERPEPGTGGVILCKGLSSLEFIYYDADGQPREEWNAKEGSTKGRVPPRVAVRMEFPNPKDPKRPYRFMTGVAIPMGG